MDEVAHEEALKEGIVAEVEIPQEEVTPEVDVREEIVAEV